MEDFREIPIVRGTNPHTGLLEGDDSGYREVPVSPLDEIDPDPMVVLEDVATLPLYAVGATAGLCTYYPDGLGGPDKVLVRAPLARGLTEADQILKPLGRKLLVVDGWRPWWVQQALWRYLRNEIVFAEGLDPKDDLSIYNEVHFGCKADDVGSYCAVVEDEAYMKVKATLISAAGDEISVVAEMLGKTFDEVAKLYLTFRANLGRNSLKIQEDAVTAHGNGGAVDLWMLDEHGRFVNLGVPFDYVPPPGTDVSPAVINYFELVDLDHYRSMVARDHTLRKYLSQLGVGEVTAEVFAQAQRERRILFHTMTKLGGSYFSLSTDLGEPWHYQLGNERGGKQSHIVGLDGSGNGCHAKLLGKSEAVWSNAVGHRLARELLGR